jgi:8-oxo-dGTP pyrophosphatase MutT (NUDIX family)
MPKDIRSCTGALAPSPGATRPIYSGVQTCRRPHRYVAAPAHGSSGAVHRRSWPGSVGPADYKDYWRIPGGAVDVGESPYDLATRELTEERGLVTSPKLYRLS